MRLAYEDLEEMEFVDTRGMGINNNNNNNNNNENDEDNDINQEDLPPRVNESVVLVFSHREAKAILQWASSAMEIGGPVRVYFHWGGRPLVFEQQTDQWKVELVLATLDHKILGSIDESE